MVLTVVTGSSGSGKTFFLNDATKSHKCTYIRQYHNIRPYVLVKRIPNFDPTRLPFWDIYVNEGTSGKIQVGGTMAGQETSGFSGGQRKLLLFELICQRAKGQSDLLLVLDEPFAGVTVDFVPFIVERLNRLRENHNILLVTNDHVETLKKMADNTITVSAIDRTKVQVNENHSVDREKAILALSVGGTYQYEASKEDLKFFFATEVAANKGLFSVAAFCIFSFGLFTASYWDSLESFGSVIIIAANIIAFFCVNPWLLALVDWRNYMEEEAEALLHSSKNMNKALMTILTLGLIVVVSFAEYGVVNLVVDGFQAFKWWLAMFMDSASLTFPFIFFGIYTELPFHAVEIFAAFPFLFMIFFSTTFSPGAGVKGVKALRYIFPRFYFWCLLPGVQDQMEGCPADERLTLLWLCMTALGSLFLFLAWLGVKNLFRSRAEKKVEKGKKAMMDQEFHDLQIEFYGENGVKNEV